MSDTTEAAPVPAAEPMPPTEPGAQAELTDVEKETADALYEEVKLAAEGVARNYVMARIPPPYQDYLKDKIDGDFPAADAEPHTFVQLEQGRVSVQKPAVPDAA